MSPGGGPTTVLQNLVVKFLGDAVSYLNSIKQVQEESKRTLEAIEGNTKSLNEQSQSIALYADQARSALSRLGAQGILRQAFAQYEGKEVLFTKLSAAIQSNNRDVEQSTAEFKDFAKAMQDTIGVTQGSVLGLIEQGLAMGLTNEQAKRAAKNALAYAEGNEEAAHSAMHLATSLEHGHVPYMLARRLGHITDPQQKLAAAQDLMNRKFEVTKSITETMIGQMRVFHNTMKAVRTELGEIIAKAVSPLIGYLRDGAEWIKALSTEAKTNIVIVLALVAAFMSFRSVLGTIRLLGLNLGLNPLLLIVAALIGVTMIWIHEVGGLAEAWDKVKEKVAELKGYTYDLLQRGLSWVIEWIDQNKRLALAIGLVVGVITALIVVKKILLALFALTNAIMTITGIKWLLINLAVMAYNASLVALTVTLSILKLAFALIMFLTSGHVIATVAAMVATIAYKISLFLLSVAYGAVSIATTLASLATFGFIAAIGAAIAVVALLASGIMAAVSTGKAFLDLLLSIPTSTGPLAAIGDLFAEWGKILWTVVRVARYDLPLAWELLKAGFALALSEVKNLWPPLWEFIKEGWIALNRFLAAHFEYEFGEKIKSVLLAMLGPISAISESAAKSIRDKLVIIGGDEAAARVRQAGADFNKAIENFKKPPDTAEIIEKRTVVRNLMDKAEETIRKGKPGVENAALDVGAAAGNAMGKGIKESKLTAALYYSAEALSRINEYADKINSPSAGQTVGAGQPLAVSFAGTTVGTQQSTKNMEEYLKQIRDTLKDSPPLKVENIDLGGAS